MTVFFLLNVCSEYEEAKKSHMILGVGAGTFAVAFTAVASILLALILAYFFPRVALWTSILMLSLPFIVFGIISSAPKAAVASVAVPHSIYRDGTVVLADDIHDDFFPVRILVLTLLCASVLGSFVVYLYDVLSALPFVAPTVQCRRKQLESLHPSWYK